MTELTVVQRAELALNFEAIKAQAVALVQESARIVEIKDKAGYQECHAARIRLRDARIATQKTGKDARDDAVKFSKSVIAKENELIAIIEPEEKRLGDLQDAIDKEVERQKQEKARIERERIDAINARFAQIKAMPLEVVGKPSATINAQLDNAEAIDIDSFDDDMKAAATYEKRLVVAALRALLDRAIADEAEAARLEEQRRAEREELERLRAEAAERQAKAAQEAAEAAAAREAQERADRERREADDRAAQAERDRMAAEQAEQLRIQREQEDAARAERERIATEEAERRGREMAEAAEARQKEADRLAAEKAEFQRQKDEAAEADRLAKLEQLTLEQAALEACLLLEITYHSTDWQTKNLRAVLDRSAIHAVPDAIDA